MTLIAHFPPAAILINSDISNQVLNTIVRQLKIDVILDGYEFDSYIANDGYWIDNLKNIEEKRILVKRNLYELQNREYFDIVAFVSNGLISIEKNKFGPPINSYPVTKIHWGQLCVFNRRNGPQNVKSKCSSCCANVSCNIRQELDELNGRICSSCSCCNGCCKCCKPTYKTLLVPKRPPNNHSGV